MNLFVKKNLEQLLQEAESKELKRSIGKWALVALGIGAIIGAGLFVRTAAASAESAGAAVTISFIVAAVGCALAGLCYAEFASMIPIAGSAYTYSYATMGEFVAWFIGWDLVLEYALGAATVSIAWSEYLNKLLKSVAGWEIPYEWCHSPFQSDNGVHGIMNIPALFIIFLLTLILIRGVSESATVNGIIVIIKVAIVILFIALGWSYINPVNHTPYMIPEGTAGHEGFFEHGWGGILAGAGTVFFAFIGFDAVSTAAQETKDPKRDMPFGILVSLAICTVLYILFAHVLTGVANYTEFEKAGKEASVAYAIETYMTKYSWLALFVTIAILAGFSSVILVMLLGQSRVFFSMSKDGLVPPIFSKVHPVYQTPYKSNQIFFVFVGLFAAFIPGDVVGDMTSIGTLFAFVLVCIGVIIMRKTDPNTPRPFKTPFSPVVPILGALVCLAMIIGLGAENWIRLIVWMLIGLVVYFAYGRHHSKLQNQKVA
ncbi:amino acid permease [Cytophagaceae bacterium YF14B1]|uniref:Amino acid permease n=1 Tax=Xanthocytophaga flava TaxID=3048013 RepID=A0AAE3QMI2_9BACT|nr:amino acid permease [Xanthocytophaga flavus]MDJ1481401.1 amino acid permease [Xanthocytophaga flavus]